MLNEDKAERRKRIMSARQALHLERIQLRGAHFAGRACFKQPMSNIDPLLLELGGILEDNAGLIADICRRAGVGRTTVQRWMHEGVDPKLSYLRAMLNAAGFDIYIKRKVNDDD